MYCARMADGTTETPEKEHCPDCAGGWGHQIDMNDSFECRVRCFVCREVQVFDPQSETDCCDHRYVGEDLWRAESDMDVWTCPVCGGKYGEHDMDCEYFVCDFCDGRGGDHEDDCEAVN